MRRRMGLASTLGLLALALAAPIGTQASTSDGLLSLSPAQGAVGTGFTATFQFSVSVCNQYSVGFWWGASGSQQLLGAASATGTGQSCTVSIQATVPSDSVAGSTYPVNAYSNPRGVSVDGGPGPSGHSEFAVTGAPSSSSTHATTTSRASTSTAATTTATSPSSAQSESTSAATTAASASSSTPPAGSGPATSDGGAVAGGATTAGPRALVPTSPGGGRPTGLILAIALALVLAGAAAAVRKLA